MVLLCLMDKGAGHDSDHRQGKLTTGLHFMGRGENRRSRGLLPRCPGQQQPTLGTDSDLNSLPGKRFHFFSDYFFAFILGFGSLLHVSAEKADLLNPYAKIFFSFFINCFGVGFSSPHSFFVLLDSGSYHREKLILGSPESSTCQVHILGLVTSRNYMSQFLVQSHIA